MCISRAALAIDCIPIPMTVKNTLTLAGVLRSLTQTDEQQIGVSMTDSKRSIEVEIDVPGTPEQVWQAVATGPGISSWYVPHQVEEKAGGTMSASFGESPEMQVNGRVAEWDPPSRVLFDGGDPDEGLAFEWFVEPNDDTSCVVRLINSGFGAGAQWDVQFDAMKNGWQLFLSNLRLHLAHFTGQAAVASLPMTMIENDTDTAWKQLMERLGLPESVSVDERVEVSGEGLPTLAGTVAEAENGRHILLVVDTPAPGTAFVATEQQGPVTMVSIWIYLYGDDGKAATERDGSMWQQVLSDFGEASKEA